MKKQYAALGALLAMTTPLLAAPSPSTPSMAEMEARIQALEANLTAVSQQAADAMAALQGARAEIDAIKAAQQAQTSDAEPVPPPVPTDAGGAAANGNAFNPAISIILDGQYAHHSLDPDAYTRSGFPLVGEGGPGAQGLSLGESEIAFSANIDEKFYGQLTVAVESEDGEDGVGIEEAYIETSALGEGLTLRAGRFFSNIGYLNNHHAHTDVFADRPLAYEAFLGNQYGDDGLQLRWVAPTDLYIEVGGEVLRGQGYPSGGAVHDGVGVTSLFAHLGGDVGVESSWLAGVSMLDYSTQDGEDGFDGDGRLYVADFTWKWAPQGNFKDGGIQLRSEYFLDDRDGVYVDAVDPALDQDWKGTRRGAYLEGVYRFSRHWEAGYRYDRLWADADGPYASDHDPYRNSAMLTWRNSEFSLVRLQLSEDRPTPDDSDHVLTLQYQTALGAHGAHKF